MEELDELEIAVGDYGMSWPFTLYESDGVTPKDLTDYTVTINIWTPGEATSLLVDGGAVVQDSPTDGTCHWLVTTVFTTKGIYYGELELAKSGFVESSKKFKIVVTESPETAASTSDLLASMAYKLQTVGAMDVYTPNEMTEFLTEAIKRYSFKYPKLEEATLDTIADSRLVDISSLESNLLWGYDERSFHWKEGVEYETGNWPRDYVAFTVRPSGHIEMSIESAPSEDDEDVNVMYYTARTASNIIHEDIVVDLACALTLMSKPLSYMNGLMGDSNKFDNIVSSLTATERRMSQAITLLSSGAPMIGSERGAALELLNGIDTSYLDDRDSGAMGKNDLAINDAGALIEKALADMDKAESFRGKSTIGKPEAEWMNGAALNLRNATTKLSQVNSWQSLEMQKVNVALVKAKALLSSEETAQSIRQQASAELNTAQAYVRQTVSRIEHLKMRIQTVKLADYYRVAGAMLMADVMPRLNSIAIRRHIRTN